MAFATSLFKSIFGSGWHPRGAEIQTLLCYTTYAGDPTSNLTPDHIGQLCLDTSNTHFYIATTAASAGWVKISYTA